VTRRKRIEAIAWFLGIGFACWLYGLIVYFAKHPEMLQL
jgi:hypothetical protein